VHDDDALDAELVVQAQHVFESGLIWRVLTVGCHRVAVCWPEHMRVAIAAAGRQRRVRRLMMNAVDGG
jgi:hypothetical protein